MSEQMTLLNVRPGDPATSQAAAKPDRTTLRDRVLHVMQEYPWGSVGKRRQELGCVPLTNSAGETITRPSQDGHQCIVWRLPDE